MRYPFVVCSAPVLQAPVFSEEVDDAYLAYDTELGHQVCELLWMHGSRPIVGRLRNACGVGFLQRLAYTLL